MDVQYTPEVRKWISLFCIPFRRSLLQNQQLRFMRCAMVYVRFGYSNQLPKGSTNAIALHIFGWFWMGPCNHAWSVFGQALFHDFLEKAISQVPNVAELGDVGVGFIDGKFIVDWKNWYGLRVHATTFLLDTLSFLNLCLSIYYLKTVKHFFVSSLAWTCLLVCGCRLSIFFGRNSRMPARFVDRIHKRSPNVPKL